MSKGQRSGDWPPALIALSDPAYAVVHEPPKGADGVSPEQRELFTLMFRLRARQTYLKRARCDRVKQCAGSRVEE